MNAKQVGRIASILAGLLGVAGCVNSDGPVFGSWTGTQPTGAGLNPSNVNLVLHGLPGASQGVYEIQATLSDPTLTSFGDRNLTWGDRWTLAPTAASGSVPVLVLHDLPNSQISRYALLPNHILVPLTSSGAPDTSRYSLHYALVPVPMSNRSYGRL